MQTGEIPGADEGTGAATAQAAMGEKSSENSRAPTSPSRKRPLLLVEALAVGNDSGLGNLARLFAEGLRGLADDADIRIILPDSGGFRPGAHCTPVFARAKPIRLWTRLHFPLLIRAHRPDAVFCLGQSLPRFRPSAPRYALAVPDAGPLEDLGWATSSHDSYNRRWLRAMAPRADAIVAISEFTKSRLAGLLGIPEKRIRVVRPIPPASAFSRRAEPGPASNPPPGFPAGDFFLALGNVEPRKNYPGLIAAYAGLKARRPDVPPLFIVGHRAWGFSEAAAAVSRRGLDDCVRFTGYLSDADRAACLSRCTLFISSSLYEGWGLPLFEALAQGKPSIYHAGSSQEEFARGMALAVDCGDSGRLSAAMESLWSDARERERLRSALRAGFGGIMGYDLEGALREALLPLLQGPLS